MLKGFLYYKITVQKLSLIHLKRGLIDKMVAKNAKKYNCSKRTIQRKIDLHKVPIPKKEPRKVVILMDTTSLGRNFGVMLFKGSYTKEDLLKYYVKTETNTLYIQDIKELKS